jgi:hypothetical protein
MTGESRKQIAEREELRLVFACIFMASEIAAARGLIDDNSELAARALRRADMLLQLSSEGGHGG